MSQPPEIAGYRIESPLGSGAMASVYKAVQESLDRPVALKVMAASLAADKSFCDRFLKEGRIVAQLNHPQIVTIYDIGVFRDCYFMAMEYVGGGTLKERIQAGLSPRDAVGVLKDLARALGYAHKRGFIHRDVKPANVLFREDGGAVLSDFGIAKTLGANATQLTATGFTVGTPSYMSPEQAMGRTLDRRSDLYSLGVLFYEMLTGQRPYRSEDSFAIALMHVNEPIPRLPGHLARYQPIVDRLLAKSPEERFESAEALLQALEDKQPPAAEGPEGTVVFPVGKDGEPQAATPGPPADAAVPGRRTERRWLPWALGLVLLLPLVGGGVYWSWEPSESVTTTRPLPPPYQPPEDPKVQTQVERLLAVAEAHQLVERLVDPPGSNARDTYQRVLDIDPGNPQALEGLREIARHYRELARASLDQQALEQARSQIKAGLSALPQDRALLDLQRELPDK
ncbi:MAG: protein kinase [Candidatus Competibacteraceae bacterium]|nr:protein kinase [Candidatus Competibacteraceae bacterium]